MAVYRITRRRLLAGAAGATAIAGGAGLWLGIDRLQGARFRRPVERDGAFAPSVYLAIEDSGGITVWLTRSEMGQGVATALPMIIAEELDADWSRVRVEQASADASYDYGSQFTAASSSVSSLWTELRRAGAAARAMLIAAAARRWDVATGSCSAVRSVVRHTGSDREATYGELASAAREERVPLRPHLKDPSAFTLIGTPVERLDLAAKVTGRAVFGLDVRVPGMLHAVVARPPTLGGSLRDHDPALALTVPGVRHVVEIDSGVAVVGDTTHAALRGRDALRITWRPGPHGGLSERSVREALQARLGGPAAIVRDDGDVEARLDAGAGGVEATYTLPYLAHAALEPMNCVAAVADGACEVWAPTQSPDLARRRAAQVAGLPVERVTVHKTYLGGGFGRRTGTDYVAEAVEISARSGRPVQVVWTREDDMRHSVCREASAHRLRAALEPDGRPAAWMHRVVTALPDAPPPGDDHRARRYAVMGAAGLPYAIEHVRVEWAGADLPVPTAIWRAVGHSYNTFAVEAFIDELAAHAGRDPLAYRRALLAQRPRLRHCMERVAELAGWEAGGRAGPGGRGLGLAVCSGFHSHVAQIAEVDATAAGGPAVTRVWCVADCGIVVNPDTVAAQLEGGILFGLSAALHGQVTLRDGAIAQSNYHDYPILRLHEAPRIDVELVASAEPPGGVGELGVPPIAPAVASAWFAATGERVRSLPLHRPGGDPSRSVSRRAPLARPDRPG